MNRNRILILSVLFILAIAGTLLFAQKEKYAQDRFVRYIVDAKKQDIKLYWKDDNQANLKSIQNLKTWLDKKNKKLVFAIVVSSPKSSTF